MNRYLKGVSKLLRNVTRAAKKGMKGITRSMKKLIHRGGNPNAVPAPPPAPAPAPVPNVPKPPRRHRKKKGALRRVTNVVRRVGKGFRNALTRVFTKKAKHRRRNKKSVVQRGSSENTSSSSGASVPGVPPAPPL